jgi:circadian clock protein KaiB
MPDAEVEIVDIYQQREMAKQADVLGAPTLVKNWPPPIRRIMGDLSNEQKMGLSLGVDV